MPSNFWMIANNERNFRITQERGFSVMGLKSQHRRKVQQRRFISNPQILKS